MDSGLLFHTLYVTITNSLPHKKRMLIVNHFNLSRSSMVIFCLRHINKACAELKETSNRNAGNCPYSPNFGDPEIGGPWHKPFQPQCKSAAGGTVFLANFIENKRTRSRIPFGIRIHVYHNILNFVNTLCPTQDAF